jgi:hypothetical protein
MATPLQNSVLRVLDHVGVKQHPSANNKSWHCIRIYDFEVGVYTYSTTARRLYTASPSSHVSRQVGEERH